MRVVRHTFKQRSFYLIFLFYQICINMSSLKNTVDTEWLNIETNLATSNARFNFYNSLMTLGRNVMLDINSPSYQQHPHFNPFNFPQGTYRQPSNQQNPRNQFSCKCSILIFSILWQTTTIKSSERASRDFCY